MRAIKQEQANHAAAAVEAAEDKPDKHVLYKRCRAAAEAEI